MKEITLEYKPVSLTARVAGRPVPEKGDVWYMGLSGFGLNLYQTRPMGITYAGRKDWGELWGCVVPVPTDQHPEKPMERGVDLVKVKVTWSQELVMVPCKQCGETPDIYPTVSGSYVKCVCGNGTDGVNMSSKGCVAEWNEKCS